VKRDLDTVVQPKENDNNLREASSDINPVSGPVMAGDVSLNTSEPLDRVKPPVKRSWSNNKIMIAVCLLLATSFIYSLWLNSNQSIVENQPTLVALKFEHSELDKAKAIKISIANQPKFDVLFAQDKIKNQALFDSPFRTWKVLADKPSTWVLATRLYDINNGGVLRFHIQGKYRGWEGHIFAVNQSDRIEQLNQLLRLLVDSEFLTIKSEHAALAKLTALHNKASDNSLIAYQLTKQNYELGYLDRATALANMMLESKPSELDFGLLHLLKTKIVLRNTNWQSASSNITAALKVFNELNLPHLESQALIQQSWYEVHNNNYPQIRKSLNFAINKARVANEPLQEMLAHLIQSSLASKDNQPVLMRNELDSAKQLFELHQLAEEHQIPVLYTLAAAANSPEERISHYIAILERPFSPLYSRRFYYAAENVRNAFIEKQQWNKAAASIKPWQRRSFISLTEAHIAFAKLEMAIGVQAAIQAFRRAQIDYDLQDALYAALLLLRHAEQGANVANPSKYIDYIKQNANHRWLRDNKLELEKLSILKDVTAL